jgi:hypothetical protein
MSLGHFSKVLKNKKIVLFLIIYMVFLSVTVYLFKVGSPPEGEVDVYKGIIHGDKTGFLGFTILFSAPSIKESGATLMVNECPFFVDSEGNIREFPYFRQFLIHNIQAAHRNGLKYCIELQVAYLGEDYNRFTIPERIWPNFFPQYNKLVLEYADLAEKYGVEMLAPMIEADGYLGMQPLLNENSLRGFEKASDWGQEILQKIRQRYHGSILWRSGITANGPEDGSDIGRWETFRDNVYINFTGYDYIGFTAATWQVPNWWEYSDPVAERRYREYLREVIEYTMMCAERDGCKGVIATEFGEERVFEEGEDKLSGYFYWFNEPAVIQYWYKERL